MKISVIRPDELSPPELARWRRLQALTADLQSPFLSPDFALAVGRVRSSARVAILEEDGEVVGFFAHERGRFGLGRPIGAGVCDCQAVVQLPGLRWDPKTLLAGSGLVAWEFDHVLASQEAIAPYHAARMESPIVDLSGGYEAYLRDRLDGRDSMKGLLRKARKLEREIGPVTFSFDVRDRSTLAAAMRWKSAQYRRTGWADRFAKPWVVELVNDLLVTHSRECAGTFSVLYAADRPIAAHLGLRSHSVLADWFPAYDVDLARYSPGLLLHLHIARAAAAAGVRHFDLGKGEEAYKDVLRNAGKLIAEGTVERASTVATLRRTLRTVQRRTHQFVVSRPMLHGPAHQALVRLRRMRWAASQQP